MSDIRRNEQRQDPQFFRTSLAGDLRERIRVLHLEDDPVASQLVSERLRRDGLPVEIERVDTLDQFAQRLATRSHALILSDFTIPGMDTFEALRLAHTTRPDLPYVFFSGTLGEAAAVEALKHGATDFVVKCQPGRLPAAFQDHSGQRFVASLGLDITELRRFQQALQDNEARLRLAVETAELGTYERDLTTNQIILNPACRAILGATEPFPPDLARRSLYPEDRERVLAAVARAFDPALREICAAEFRILRPDGSVRWVTGRGRVLFDDRATPPRPVRFIGVLNDITARKQAEVDLKRNEQRYRSFVEATNQVIWRTNARGEVDQPIPSWNAFTGQTEEQAAGFGWMNAIHPEDRPRVAEAWRSASAAKTTYEIEYRLRHHDGRWLHILARGVPILEPDGSIREYIGACMDISDQRRAEENLRDSEQKFRVLFEQAAIGMGRVRFNDARWMDVNDAFCAMLGYTREEMLATPWPQITHPEDVDLDLIPFRHLAAGELEHYAVEKRFIHKRGHHLWARLNLSLVRDAQGRPDYEIAVIENIDARKQAEYALRESEERFRLLVERASDALLLHDSEGRFVDVNRQATESLGYTREELLHMNVLDLEQDLDAVQLQQLWTHTVPEEPRTLYGRHRRKDGTTFPVEIRISTFNVGARHLYLAQARDITERKRIEQDLQRRTIHLQLLHQAAARLLIGQKPVDLLRQLHSQIARAFGTDVFTLYQTAQDNGRLRLVACAGVSEEERRRLKTLRHGQAICAKPAEALQPMVATRIQTSEAPSRRFTRKLGFRSYLYYPLILNNRLHGTLAFASRTRDDYDRADIDFFHTIASTLAEALERERLEAELQRHASHLEELVQERTAKLQEMIAELEHFSYTITHDMRAPLRAMRGFGDLLLEECGSCLHGQGREYLQHISDAADRMDKLIIDALQYSTLVRGEFPLQPVDSGALLRGILGSYSEFQPPHAHIRVEGQLPVVLANEAGLTQCFSNLLGNAVKFVHPGQTPEVRVWAEEVETSQPEPRTSEAPPEPERERTATSLSTWHIPEQTSQAALPTKRQASPMVRIWFEDQGIGIKKEHHDRIWVMFQRLNKSYGGTGIGLALVRKAVERMGGRVGIESQPGQGSRFWVELRRANETAGSRRPNQLTKTE